MRLIFHIFRKDARRLWWEIAISTTLVALLARMDYYRADYLPGPMESMFNLLAPLAWAYLAALAIHGEAPADDRQTWLTQPYPRGALIAAKALFLAAFIHLPLLLFHAAILLAKGFDPAAAAGPLLARQAMVAGALTIPAAALAAVTRNLAQFFLAAIVVAGAGALVRMAGAPPSYPWIPIDEVRRGIALAALGGASAGIVWIQYTRRRTGLARAIAVLAAVSTAAIFLLLPRRHTVALGCAISPGDRPELSIRLAPLRGTPPPFAAAPGPQAHVAIPLQIENAPPDSQVRFEQIELRLVDPGGAVLHIKSESRLGMTAGISVDQRQQAWQILTMDRAVFERLKKAPVTVSGKTAAIQYRELERSQMRIDDPPRHLDRAGRLFSVPTTDHFGREMLKVGYETPFDEPYFAYATLSDPSTGKQWRHRMNDSVTHVSYPAVTWLSPLNRSQTYFHLTELEGGPGSQWQAPREILARGEIEFAPTERTGCATIAYTLRDVELEKYRLLPMRR